MIRSSILLTRTQKPLVGKRRPNFRGICAAGPKTSSRERKQKAEQLRFASATMVKNARLIRISLKVNKIVINYKIKVEICRNLKAEDVF